MRAITAIPRLPGLALLAWGLGLGLGWPALAAAAPSPVQDPMGLLLPLPGCGMAGPPLTLRLLHQVRARALHRARRQPRRPPRPPAARLPPPVNDTGAMAWQALYGCALAVPEEAGITAGARPLRPT